jgi:hypothetical protein
LMIENSVCDRLLIEEVLQVCEWASS